MPGKRSKNGHGLRSKSRLGLLRRKKKKQLPQQSTQSSKNIEVVYIVKNTIKQIEIHYSSCVSVLAEVTTPEQRFIENTQAIRVGRSVEAAM